MTNPHDSSQADPFATTNIHRSLADSDSEESLHSWNAQFRIAVWQGDRQQFEEMLGIEPRGNVNLPGGDDGETILHEVCAAQGDRVDIAQMMIDYGADVNACNLDYEQPLHAACLAGNVGVARLLLAHKADYYAKDSEDRVPLSLTCYDMHVEVARALLDAGFDVNYKDPALGNGPVHWVIREVGLYRPSDSMESLGESACRMMTLFLDSGADVNAQNTAGEIALHLASRGGQEQLVALLLQRGADALSTVTTQGHETALHYAVRNHHNNIIRILCNHGANINARDCLGRTPLHQLCRAQSTLTLSADNTTRNAGRHRADPISTIILLCMLGADVNTVDNSGQSPLHDAVRLVPAKGESEGLSFAKTLLSHGADQFERDSNGDTVLLAACRHGYSLAVIELLLNDAPRACGIVDKDGWLGFEVAGMNGGCLTRIFLIIRRNPCVCVFRKTPDALDETNPKKQVCIRPSF